MTLKQELQAEIAALQAKIDILNSVPEDTFFFGTIMLFSAATGQKWYYVKVAEELWQRVGGTEQKDLATWILLAKLSNVGNFEVYQMSVAELPFYATA